jgi:Skp family chaperone for outer membrane proteins
MRHSRFWIVSIAAVVALTGLVGAYASGRMMAAKPTAVGCVDVFQVFATLKEKTQIEADIKSINDRMGEEQRQKGEELKQMEEAMKILMPGSADYLKAEDEYTQKALEFRAWTELQKAKLVRENKIRVQALYNKILAATAAVAKDNGFDLVIYKEGAVDFSRVQDPRLLDDAVRNRKVLYSAEGMDLTDQVKTRMDNEWNARAK